MFLRECAVPKMINFHKTISFVRKKLFSEYLLKNLTIRHKIILATVTMILIPMCISGLYFYFSLSKVMIKTAYNNLEQQIGKINENIELSFDILDNTSLHFLSNKNIRSWLSNDISLDGDNWDLLQRKIELESDLKYSMLFNNAWEMKLVTTAYLFINESTFAMVSRAPVNLQSIEQNNVSIYKYILKNGTIGKRILAPSSNDRTIYFTRTISKPGNTESSLSLIIGTDENFIYQKYSDLLSYNGSIAYITDKAGVIYSCSDKSLLGKSLGKVIHDYNNSTGINEIQIDKETYFFASQKIGSSGLTFTFGIPQKQIMSKLSSSIMNYLLITIVILFVCLVISIFVSFRVTYVIKDLLFNINKVKLGDYTTKMPSYKDSELNVLSNTFNKMTAEIKYLINQVYEKQLLLKEADIKFLQSQMNPHFLFNILVTIGIKAKISKDEIIYKMINSLGNLLQASIYTSGKAEITIRQELEYIRFYLYLQKVRFEEKLQYEINISDELILDYHIPKLCIEPIVENAVVHGIESKIEVGSVIVNVSQHNEIIVFEVIDDGMGFETDKIDLDICTNRKEGHNNIGLNNTNRRLKLIYGEQYGISIESAVGKGSKVIVKIPADTRRYH